FIESKLPITAGHAIEGRIRMDGNQAFNFGFANDWAASPPMVISHGFGGNISLSINDQEVGPLEFENNTWTTLSVMWEPGYAELWSNRMQYLSLSSPTISDIYLTPGLQLWGSADSRVYAKWIFVRKWTSDSPVHGSWESTGPCVLNITATTTTTQPTNPNYALPLIVVSGIIVTLAVVGILMYRKRG
ncbi:MAG: hypothetical protein RTU92_08480, partial [Candidatus Thorarchaeota archaeon]